MRRLVNLKWLLISFLFLPLPILADSGSFGSIAANLFTDEQSVRQIIRAICIITGAGLILGAVIQYKKHRDNPVEVRLSTPILSLLSGLALIALAFIPWQL